MPKKQLFTLEYPVRCSPAILYGFLSTPAGLGEWFADKVDERDNRDTKKQGPSKRLGQAKQRHEIRVRRRKRL